MTTTIFETWERFYCKWESGAKEYFNTLEEALQKARSMYVKKIRMTDENYAYWLKQKSIVGKEVVVSQQIDIVSYNSLSS